MQEFVYMMKFIKDQQMIEVERLWKENMVKNKKWKLKLKEE